MSTARVALSLSGGIDSAYYLWRWLQRHPRERIIVHHCRLAGPRLEAEQRASQRILAALDVERVDYIETSFSRGDIPGRLQDIEIISWLMGLALRDQTRWPQLTTVLMPRCAEELAGNRPLAAHLAARQPLEAFRCPGNRISAAVQLLHLGSRRPLRLRSPWQVPKAQMIATMPLALVEAAHFCRTPSATGQPCAACHACRHALEPVRQRLAAAQVSPLDPEDPEGGGPEPQTIAAQETTP